MKLVADLHIHSHLSRATSKDLDLEHLHATAQKKGIHVVGTGDFTHPAWLAELREKLVPAEPGLFRLRDDLARAATGDVPGACHGEVRFLLSVEISSIYKRGDRTRKVHNLVYAPDFEVAEAIAKRLGGIGNITSDGRPILGLDSRDLLEIVLESSQDAYLVPAHVWTPWFSALGAQSGFDSINECFGDLAGHIFAAETGLSSDPAMNWRLSQLDRLALVSSSDAHSPEKLGREATLFDCDLSYFALRDALRDKREGFLGTVEFFPEEGKYHFDGHRKCDVVLTPREARELGRICPVCKRPLTAGVAGRVEDLADREEGARPDGAKPFQSLVPLAEVLSELCEAGPTSAKVKKHHENLLRRVGPELCILRDAPAEDLAREGPPLLAEAIERIRRGEVIAKPGYDGEYGVVRVWEDAERRRLLSQTSFGFMLTAPPKREDGPSRETESRDARPRDTQSHDDASRDDASRDSPSRESQSEQAASGEPPAAEAKSARPRPWLEGLNEAQIAAVQHEGSPLVIVAGPGTGKTKTVVHRIARLVREGGESPRSITAITFTKKAAGELRERLTALLGDAGEQVEAMTFHALGQRLLGAFGRDIGVPESFGVADEDASLACVREALSKVPFDASAKEVRERISWAKAHLQTPPETANQPPEGIANQPPEKTDDFAAVYAAYEAALGEKGLLDFDDLVRRSVELLASSERARAFAEERARRLFVDEYQDVQLAQYRMVRLLAPRDRAEGLTVVGDPDQAIYGFRGSDPSYFQRFGDDYPSRRRVVLTENYRSPATIVRAATMVIERARDREKRVLAPRAAGGAPVLHVRSASCIEEADRVAVDIQRALGGMSLLDADGSEPPLALHEIAVLFRTSAQAVTLGRSLEAAGIPYFVRGEESSEVRLEPQKVALLTLHASKGLEFPLVFVTGCDDGLLPLRLPGLRTSDFEEERRLLYVGMTRAKQRLVLTSAKRRQLFGQTLEYGPTPFLAGLPRDVIIEATVRTKRRGRQMSLF